MHRSRLSTVMIDLGADVFERGAEFWSAALGGEWLVEDKRYETLRGRLGGEGGLYIGLQRCMDDPQKFHLDIPAAAPGPASPARLAGRPPLPQSHWLHSLSSMPRCSRPGCCFR